MNRKTKYHKNYQINNSGYNDEDRDFMNDHGNEKYHNYSHRIIGMMTIINDNDI